MTACSNGESRDISAAFEQRLPGAAQAPVLVFVYSDN